MTSNKMACAVVRKPLAPRLAELLRARWGTQLGRRCRLFGAWCTDPLRAGAVGKALRGTPHEILAGLGIAGHECELGELTATDAHRPDDAGHAIAGLLELVGVADG